MTFQFTDDAPAIYDRVLVPIWFGLWAEALVDLVDPKPGEQVLDVGCATGVATRLIYDRVAPAGRVDGMDANPKMLAQAQKLSEGRPIAWIRSDVTQRADPDEGYDAILSQFGYHAFADKPVALASLTAQLAPRGRLACSVWDGHSVYTSALCKAVARIVSPDLAAQLAAPREAQGPEQLAQDFLAAGLRDVRVTRQERTIDIPDLRDFLPQHLAATPQTGLFGAADPCLRDALVAEVESHLAPYLQDGRLVYSDAVHVVMGYR